MSPVPLAGVSREAACLAGRALMEGAVVSDLSAWGAQLPVACV